MYSVQGRYLTIALAYTDVATVKTADLLEIHNEMAIDARGVAGRIKRNVVEGAGRSRCCAPSPTSRPSADSPGKLADAWSDGAGFWFSGARVSQAPACAGRPTNSQRVRAGRPADAARALRAARASLS